MRHILLARDRISVLIGTSLFLVLAYPMVAGDEQARDSDHLVLQNPTPELSAAACRSLLVSRLSGIELGYMLVLIKIADGKATEVRALMSSGSLQADREICQFVLDHRVFRRPTVPTGLPYFFLARLASLITRPNQALTILPGFGTKVAQTGQSSNRGV